MPGEEGSQEQTYSQPCSSQETGISSQEDEWVPQGGRKPRGPTSNRKQREHPPTPVRCCLCRKFTIPDESAPSANCDFTPKKQVATMAGAHVCKGYCRVHTNCLRAAFGEALEDCSMSQPASADEDVSLPPLHHVSCRGFCVTFGVLHPAMAAPLACPTEQRLVVRQLLLARSMRAMHTIVCRVGTLLAFLVGQLTAKDEDTAADHWETLHSIQILIRSDGGEMFLPAILAHPVAQHLALLYFMRLDVFPEHAGRDALDPARQKVLEQSLRTLNLDGEEDVGQARPVAPWKGSFVDIKGADNNSCQYPVDKQGVPLPNAFDVDPQRYPPFNESCWKYLQGGIHVVAHAMGVSPDAVSFNEEIHTAVMRRTAETFLQQVQDNVKAVGKLQAATNSQTAADNARQLKNRHAQARKACQKELERHDASDAVKGVLESVKQSIPTNSQLPMCKERYDELDRWVMETMFRWTQAGEIRVLRALPDQVGRQEVKTPFVQPCISRNHEPAATHA
jgi:hypothetical protein